MLLWKQLCCQPQEVSSLCCIDFLLHLGSLMESNLQPPKSDIREQTVMWVASARQWRCPVHTPAQQPLCRRWLWVIIASNHELPVICTSSGHSKVPFQTNCQPFQHQALVPGHWVPRHTMDRFRAHLQTFTFREFESNAKTKEGVQKQN